MFGNNTVTDADPEFVSRPDSDFRLTADSPAIDAGDPVIGSLYPFDFEGKSRIDDSAPDIGAFEWLEEQEEE